LPGMMPAQLTTPAARSTRGNRLRFENHLRVTVQHRSRAVVLANCTCDPTFAGRGFIGCAVRREV
jgi:hypothetical protein